MVLRIQRVSDGQLVILRLSGRLRSEDLDQLKEQIEGNANRVLLDLVEVKLVDRDVVLFLGDCEAKGVQLSQCPPYIREWIDRERATQGNP
jgi:anti-anti-sigma regulatory factor